jgi:hypothetical protein
VLIAGWSIHKGSLLGRLADGKCGAAAYKRYGVTHEGSQIERYRRVSSSVATLYGQRLRYLHSPDDHFWSIKQPPFVHPKSGKRLLTVNFALAGVLRRSAANQSDLPSFGGRTLTLVLLWFSIDTLVLSFLPPKER